MLKTRGKRDLNLGSQPVISKVSSAPGHDGAKSMLSSDAKIRGHMINLKKIMMPCLQDKLKGLTSTLIRDSVVLFFAGADATNLHFSNKATHTGFIELGTSLRLGSDGNVETSMKLVIETILKDFNEFMMILARDASCLLTREILAECKADGENDGVYFVAGGNGDRQTCDFRLGGGVQPFVEVRHIPNSPALFDKYGVFYSPLKMIASDIKIGMAKYGTSDWKFRETTLQESITRGGLTFTNWTIYSLLRECFPIVAMRKMKVKVAVVTMIEANIKRISAEVSENDSTKLRKELLAELDDYQNDKRLESSLQLEFLLKRSMQLGYLPQNEAFEEAIDNTYNRAILREIRVVMLP